MTLTAQAATGSEFADWGGCDAASGATCTATMDAAKSITASFNLQMFVLPVSKTSDLLASGTVTSSPPGINCGCSCLASYVGGTTVILTAHPCLLAGVV